MTKKLYRSNSEKMVGGIFGGLASYFEVDATFLRLIFVILLFTPVQPSVRLPLQKHEVKP
ncbi:PspC domain-containing protein [Oceanobacillus picturae]|uniref:PspC domain-containing protein n=1 Tax=Oceanobacillus picturae TaxID=171693 RepID=UPI000E696860|nr:PspC domain-containing protein [Oceanobacillus picturae]RIU94523.1 PspC domain-containing protein [Oceanobacillus picturae]